MPEPPFDLFLPTELMLLSLLVFIVYRIFVTRDFDRDILRHPVSVIVYCLIAWVFVTSVTSSKPLVSFKNLAVRVWYIASFYLLASEIFRDHRKIKKYFLAYTAGMTPVVIYFLVRMYRSGIFNQAAAYSAPNPFFLDHTAIGAGLGFLIPLLLYFLFSRDSSFSLRLILSLQLILFTAAFILSYSRAAWISPSKFGEIMGSPPVTYTQGWNDFTWSKRETQVARGSSLWRSYQRRLSGTS